jgi:hypothetical protein
VSDDLDFMPAEPKPKAEPTPAVAAKPTPAAKPSSEPKPSSGSAPTDGEPDQRVELPTWNRARRKRQANVRAAEQEDAFQRGVRKAGRQAIDFPKLVLGVIVIAVGVIAGTVVLSQKSSTVNADASRVLSTATVAIVRGRVVPIENQVGAEEEIARLRFPIYATEAERQQAIGTALEAALAVDREVVELDARLVAAANDVRIGEFATAIEHYDAFLAEVDTDHPLRFMALEGKGIALEAQQDLEGALLAFQAVAPRPTDFYRHMALYHQGRVLEGLDRKDEALAIYEQFFVEFPPTQAVMATPLIRDRVEALDPEFAARIATEPVLDTTQMPEFPSP